MIGQKSLKPFVPTFCSPSVYDVYGKPAYVYGFIPSVYDVYENTKSLITDYIYIYVTISVILPPNTPVYTGIA